MNNNVLDNEPYKFPTKVMNPANKKTYFVYNISDGKDNWSQRRSQYEYVYKDYKTNGYSFCNVHTIAMGLIYTGVYDKYKKEIDAKYPELVRFPDKLAKFMIEDKISREYFKKRFPDLSKNFEDGKSAKETYSPNEVHNSLSYLTNRFLDIGNVTFFSTHTSWLEIINDIIYRGTPVGVSGRFCNMDHIVLIVGFAYEKLENDNEPGEYQIPDYVIIDDPFGNMNKGYKAGTSGNDIWIPFQKFSDQLKPLNSPQFKFAHRFIRPEYLGF